MKIFLPKKEALWLARHCDDLWGNVNDADDPCRGCVFYGKCGGPEWLDEALHIIPEEEK